MSRKNGKAKVAKIKLSSVRTDGGTQARDGLDAGQLEVCRQGVRDGVKLPPVVVFEDADGVRWLADGFHRVEACRAEGKDMIAAEVLEGTRRDAVLYAVGANSVPGVLRRTNADKRLAVEMLLADPEWSRWPQTRIAKAAGVHQSFVSRMVQERQASDERISNGLYDNHSPDMVTDAPLAAAQPDDPESGGPEEPPSAPAPTPPDGGPAEPARGPCATFDGWWERLAGEGLCEGLGGADYERVKALWEGAGRPAEIALFIRKHACRLPGDDTEEVEREEAEEKSRPRNGAVLYDWKAFHDSFGKLYRQMDAAGNAYGKAPTGMPHKDGPRAERLRRRLSEFKADFEGWVDEMKRQARARK